MKRTFLKSQRPTATGTNTRPPYRSLKGIISILFVALLLAGTCLLAQGLDSPASADTAGSLAGGGLSVSEVVTT